MNTENIYLALQLMIVGMATVFLILGMIIGLGKLLIKMTNARPSGETPDAPQETLRTQEPDAVSRTVIELAIKEITHGKGKVSSIKKV